MKKETQAEKKKEMLLRGKKIFILKNGILYFGMPFSIVMTLFNFFLHSDRLNNRPFTLVIYIIWFLLTGVISGTLWGLYMWRFLKK